MRGMAAMALYLGDPQGHRQPNEDLARWLFYRMNLLSPKIALEGGQSSRTPPPQGAHANVDAPHFVAQGYSYARLIERYDPRLHDAWSWLYWNNAPLAAGSDPAYTYKGFPPSPREAVTDAAWKGARPALKSEKFYDYGVVFRRGFAAPDEMTVSVTHQNSTYYRWGQNQSGQIFYFADGKAWSWNGSEDSGDNQAASRFGNQYLTAFATLRDGRRLMIGKTHVTENLYDFAFVGQYTIPGNEGYDAWGQNGDYRRRCVTLVDRDCLVIFDQVRDPSVAGDFRWFNRADWKLPNIVQVKPGARGVPVDNDYADPRNKTQTPACRGLSFQGKGDFLTVVSHKAVQAVPTDYGTLVNGVHKVFYRAAPLQFRDHQEVFEGTAGYLSGGKAALFDGTRLGLRGFVFEKVRRAASEGNFGFAVEIRGERRNSRPLVGPTGNNHHPPALQDRHGTSFISMGGRLPIHCLRTGWLFPCRTAPIAI